MQSMFFTAVWHLHQFFLRAGIIHDNHLHPIAFILVLRDAWCILECYVWPSSTSFDTISNGVLLNATGCVAFIGLLCLAAFHPAWYLHQILQCEGITHDHFMCQIAFVFLLLQAWHVFDWCACQHYIALHWATSHCIHNSSQHSRWISSYISESMRLLSHCVALHDIPTTRSQNEGDMKIMESRPSLPSTHC